MAVKGLQRHKTVMEILTEHQVIEDSKLQQAEADAQQTGKKLQQSLLELKLIEPEKLIKLLSDNWQVEVSDLSGMDIDPDQVKIIPEAVARRHLAVPFAKNENVLSVAMADPRDLFITEDLQMRTGLEIKPSLALPTDILSTLDAAYGKGGGALMSKIRKEEEESGLNLPDEWKMPEGETGLEVVKQQAKQDIAKVDASAPEIEKMVNAIILSALQAKASDIHIEPFEDAAGKNSRILLRFRIDGVLRAGPFKIPWAYRNALIAKLK
ncbi:MAG: hypothetical protein AAB578_02810, partial [Elusimicrobiota bacterium]